MGFSADKDLGEREDRKILGGSNKSDFVGVLSDDGTFIQEGKNKITFDEEGDPIIGNVQKTTRGVIRD